MDGAERREAAVSLKVDRIVKDFGRYRALEAVSLDVEPGEFLTLLGPSGSGKTTLLMVIAGFVRPDGGRLLLDGRDITRLAPHRRGIGMMFQNYALFPHKTVGENIAYPLWLRRVPRAERLRRVEEALELVQLQGYADRTVESLSGGQKQRVALARATVFRPRILLMDEPLSALDKRLREQMQVELRRLHRKLEMTTICVTHDQREALTMSDRIAVMDRGRIIQHGTPRAIYERPSTAFVANFIGESSLLPIEVRNGEASFAGQPILLSEAPNADGRHHLMVRPEKLCLLNGDVAPGVNCFSARLTDLVYEGESVALQLDVGEASLRMRMLLRQDDGEARRLPAVGAELKVGLDRRDSVLVPGA